MLGLVTCKLLYKRFPEYQEGDLTKVKSVVVSRKTCAAFGQSLGLGEFLFLGKGVGRAGEMPSTGSSVMRDRVADDGKPCRGRLAYGLRPR